MSHQDVPQIAPDASQVFRKYSHSLGPDALAFIEEILDKHDVSDEEAEYSVELIAKEYNKQDGASHSNRPSFRDRNRTYARCPDAVMKVTLAILQRVYEIMQGHAEQNSQGEEDALEPDNHLFFIDAFDMPLWHWSPERSTFERYGYTCFYRLVVLIECRAAHSSTVSGSGDSRVLAVRDRLGIIRQTVMRNEHFSPSTLPSRDREHLLTASHIQPVNSSLI